MSAFEYLNEVEFLYYLHFDVSCENQVLVLVADTHFEETQYVVHLFVVLHQREADTDMPTDIYTKIRCTVS